MQIWSRPSLASLVLWLAWAPVSARRHTRNLDDNMTLAELNASGYGVSASQPHVKFSLLRTQEPCTCVLSEEVCSCEEAMRLMDCIVDACTSGSCYCEMSILQDTCVSVASTCPGLSMRCTKEKAECLVDAQSRSMHSPTVNSTGEKYDVLRELKEKKCRLRVAADDGWLNARRSLKSVEEAIRRHLEDLKAMGQPLPDMRCEEDEDSGAGGSSSACKSSDCGGSNGTAPVEVKEIKEPEQQKIEKVAEKSEDEEKPKATVEVEEKPKEAEEGHSKEEVPAPEPEPEPEKKKEGKEKAAPKKAKGPSTVSIGVAFVISLACVAVIGALYTLGKRA